MSLKLCNLYLRNKNFLKLMFIRKHDKYLNKIVYAMQLRKSKSQNNLFNRILAKPDGEKFTCPAVRWEIFMFLFASQ